MSHNHHDYLIHVHVVTYGLTMQYSARSAIDNPTNGNLELSLLLMLSLSANAGIPGQNLEVCEANAVVYIIIMWQAIVNGHG